MLLVCHNAVPYDGNVLQAARHLHNEATLHSCWSRYGKLQNLSQAKAVQQKSTPHSKRAGTQAHRHSCSYSNHSNCYHKSTQTLSPDETPRHTPITATIKFLHVNQL